MLLTCNIWILHDHTILELFSKIFKNKSKKNKTWFDYPWSCLCMFLLLLYFFFFNVGYGVSKCLHKLCVSILALFLLVPIFSVSYITVEFFFIMRHNPQSVLVSCLQIWAYIAYFYVQSMLGCILNYFPISPNIVTFWRIHSYFIC